MLLFATVWYISSLSWYCLLFLLESGSFLIVQSTNFTNSYNSRTGNGLWPATSEIIIVVESVSSLMNNASWGEYATFFWVMLIFQSLALAFRVAPLIIIHVSICLYALFSSYFPLTFVHCGTCVFLFSMNGCTIYARAKEVCYTISWIKMINCKAWYICCCLLVYC